MKQLYLIEVYDEDDDYTHVAEYTNEELVKYCEDKYIKSIQKI